MQLPQPLAALHGVIWTWEDWKLFVERSISFSSDALHIMVGVCIQLAVARLSRRGMSSWLPWLVVLLLTFLNELGDLRYERWPNLAMQLGEGTKDVLLTMFVPTLLFLSARYIPGVFSGGRRRRK